MSLTETAREALQTRVHGSRPLDADELEVMDAWWRAANYLSVGQIYLLDNPLLLEPLPAEHVKPRLLGHWGARGDSASRSASTASLTTTL